jgi:hypothetical protein
MPTDSLLAIVSVLVFNMNLKHTLKKSKKSYSYINTSFSDDTVFPKLRLGILIFIILKKLGKEILEFAIHKQ